MSHDRILLLFVTLAALAILFGTIFVLGNESPDKQRRRFAESADLSPGEAVQAVFRVVFYRAYDYRSAKMRIVVVTNRRIYVQDLRLGRWPARELPTLHPRNFYFGNRTASGGGRPPRLSFVLDDIKYYVDPKFNEDVAAADAALANTDWGKRDGTDL